MARAFAHAGIWRRSDEATPNYADLSRLIKALAAEIDGLAMVAGHCWQPCAIERAESWVLPRGDACNVFTRIEIELAPGRSDRSLASWWQWRHVVAFTWSNGPAPQEAIDSL